MQFEMKTPAGIGITADNARIQFNNDMSADLVLTDPPAGLMDGLSADNIEVQISRNRSVMEATVIIKDTGEVIDRLPVTFKSRQNTLDYLSVSKITTYEQCPAKFHRQYMSDEGIEEDNGNFFTKFGSILHGTVEKASKYYLDNGIVVDPVSIFDEEWRSHDLTGFDAYREGKELILDYFKRNPIDQRNDIAKLIEYEWRGQLGGVEFGLMFDYVGTMINDPDVGVLKDYKSNRMPYTPDELENSFQLRVYTLVLKRYLMPHIKKWVAGYEMFRYGWQQCPEWSDEDLLDAERYIANIAEQIKNDNTWVAKLNKYCGYCNYRAECKTYGDFINNPKRFIDAIVVDGSRIEDVERNRELMTACEKIIKTRKDECADIVKTAIERAMINGEKVVVDGNELQLYANGTQSYNYYDTRNVLLVNGSLDLLDKCVSISKTKLEKSLADKPHLKLALSQCTTTNYASPYIVKKKANNLIGRLTP